MTNYTGVDCPICHKPLLDDTSLAVCPECGAPYHRACILQAGACSFDDLHTNHQAWKNPNAPSEGDPDQQDDTASDAQNSTNDTASDPSAQAYRQCDKCGLKNPADGLFCEVCGNPLSKVTTSHTGSPSSTAPPQAQAWQPRPNHEETPLTSGMSWNAFSASNPNPLFFAPLGGLDPEETIVDLPVKDLAIFTGQNASYFLPKFKSYAAKERASMSFNFAAALFQSFYFFYRKMYLIGFMVFFATTMLSIPAMLLTIDQMRNQFIGPAATPWFYPEDLNTLIQVCSTMMLVLRLSIGLLFNKLYLMHTVTKVKQIQKQQLPHQQYVEALTKAGSVSMRMVLLVIGLIITGLYAATMFFLF